MTFFLKIAEEYSENFNNTLLDQCNVKFIKSIHFIPILKKNKLLSLITNLKDKTTFGLNRISVEILKRTDYIL